MWTSLDVGMQFEKSNNITAQLGKMRGRRESNADAAGGEGGDTEHAPTPEALFAKLNGFYKQQLEDAAETGVYGTSAGDLAYASPSSINRLLNMYATGKRIKSRKPKPMRSAYHAAEGLSVHDPALDSTTISRLHSDGCDATSSLEQLAFQDPRHATPRFKDHMRPVATLLRTKRSKRCKNCRTLLSRPEPKVSTTRYKIRVLASSNLPTLTLRSLTSPASNTSTSHPLTLLPQPSITLKPGAPHQYILTLTNPLFDPIRITLLTPSSTANGSKVTLLCPSFDVGANTDVWDEALSGSVSAQAKRARGGGAGGGIGTINEEGAEKQPEVGKVWERGRNWTSVVMEVIPGLSPSSALAVHSTPAPAPAVKDLRNSKEESNDDDNDDEDPSSADEDEINTEDAILEIPVFVRVSYETEAGGAGAAASALEERREGSAVAKESREVDFWCVLGVGRIS